MTSRNRGIALPIVLGVVLCLAVWIASLSWTMTNSRGRYLHMVKLRRAYFMARSAHQHFLLKLKTLERRMPESVLLLQNTKNEQWPVLSSYFIQDIVQPHEFSGSYSGDYRIGSFTVESLDLEKAAMSIQIQGEGEADGCRETIRRIYRVTR